LVPSEPRDDLKNLVATEEIDLIWPEGAGFIDTGSLSET
jgi:hypothetical protein